MIKIIVNVILLFCAVQFCAAQNEKISLDENFTHATYSVFRGDSIYLFGSDHDGGNYNDSITGVFKILDIEGNELNTTTYPLGKEKALSKRFFDEEKHQFIGLSSYDRLGEDCYIERIDINTMTITKTPIDINIGAYSIRLLSDMYFIEDRYYISGSYLIDSPNPGYGRSFLARLDEGFQVDTIYFYDDWYSISGMFIDKYDEIHILGLQYSIPRGEPNHNRTGFDVVCHKLYSSTSFYQIIREEFFPKIFYHIKQKEDSNISFAYSDYDHSLILYDGNDLSKPYEYISKYELDGTVKWSLDISELPKRVSDTDEFPFRSIPSKLYIDDEGDITILVDGNIKDDTDKVYHRSGSPVIIELDSEGNLLGQKAMTYYEENGDTFYCESYHIAEKEGIYWVIGNYYSDSYQRKGSFIYKTELNRCYVPDCDLVDRLGYPVRVHEYVSDRNRWLIHDTKHDHYFWYTMAKSNGSLLYFTEGIDQDQWISTGEYWSSIQGYVRMSKIDEEGNALSDWMDFNLIEGDRQVTPYYNADTTDFIYMDVIATDSITLLNGARRKTLTLRCEERPEDYPLTYWIEGIGDVYNFRRPIKACGDASGEVLVCLYQDGELTWSNPDYNYCGPNSTKDHDSPEQVKIYPNPTDGWIHITSLQKLVNYTIYSMNGTLVQQGNNPRPRIQIKNLPTGTYIIKFIDEKGSIYTEKLMVF